MSVTPPPGFGIYARYYRPDLGLRNAAVVLGFQNVGNQVATTAVGAIRTACSTAGSWAELSRLGTSWNWVGDYCLVNVAGSLSSSNLTVSTPGTRAVDTPPPNVSNVVIKRTDYAGRQYRGRMAVPAGFLDEALIGDDGMIDGGEVTAMQARMVFFLAQCTSVGRPLYLIHDVPKGGGPAPAPTAVTFLETTPLVGSQRRRLRG